MLSEFYSIFFNNFQWNFVKWNLVDKKVFSIQHNIFLASKNSNFRLARNKQKLLIRSFWSRLMVVRDILDDKYFKDSFLISSKDKFKFISFLNYVSISNTNYNFYLFKSNGLSISFKFFPFYRICFDYLLRMSFLPLVETKLNKFLLSERPFKLYYNLPVELNKTLLKNTDKPHYFIMEISTFFSSTTKIWVQKNFPLEFNLLKIESSCSLFSYNSENYRNFKSFYSVVLNFILNEMVVD